MIVSFYNSTIGKKFFVALTGVIMFVFVIGHLLGNLQIFLGPETLNDYAHFLKNNKEILWPSRVVLLVAIAVHIIATIQLRRMNRAARPARYAEHKPVQAKLSSRFMMLSGLFLLAYIVYHIIHFTVGAVHPNFSATDIYRNVIIGFSNPLVSGVYIVAMVFLGFHLNHGVYSFFQTLGLNHPKYNRCRRCFATVCSVGIPLGYISIPAAVLLGILR